MSQLIRFSPLPTIKELLMLYNLKAMKHLSQNFLLDLRVTNKIVAAAGNLRGSEVCEIGPGPGGITRSILMNPVKKLTVIEVDQRFQPILEALQKTVGDRMQIVFANIMSYDFSHTFDNSLKRNWEDDPPKIHIIGNLPFNVADPLLIQFLQDIALRRNAWSYGRVRLTLTFQDEVAKRITSEILSKHRCRLSVMCQNWCKVTYKLKINGTAFLPKPKVNAGVVHIEPLVKPITDISFQMMEKVVTTIFNCRQKYSINPATRLFPEVWRKDLGRELFELADLDREIRPYEISIEEWRRICTAYKTICDRDPRLYDYNYRGPRSTREEGWKLDKLKEEIEVSQ